MGILPPPASSGWRGWTVDPDSSQPPSAQLGEHLRQLIRSGQLARGQHLPPERALAQMLGISRATVHRCYEALREEGLLRSSGRGGTAVHAEPVRPALGRLKGFTQEMQELGMTPSTRIVSRRIVADTRIASLFGRPSRLPFLHIVRVRLGDGMPMTRESAWYDIDAVPALQDWDGQGSAYERIRTQGKLPLAWAEQTIEAVLSTPLEDEAFGFPQPQPCLLLKRRTYAQGGIMVEYVEGVFRGDAYVYRMRLD